MDADAFPPRRFSVEGRQFDELHMELRRLRCTVRHDPGLLA